MIFYSFKDTHKSSFLVKMEAVILVILAYCYLENKSPTN